MSPTRIGERVTLHVDFIGCSDFRNAADSCFRNNDSRHIPNSTLFFVSVIELTDDVLLSKHNMLSWAFVLTIPLSLLTVDNL
jgi:hypothetical protein